MRKIFNRLAWSVLLLAGCGGPVDQNGEPVEEVSSEICGYSLTATQEAQIQAAREATGRYHNFDNAVADGYVDTGLPCIDGQGYHYIRPDLLDTYDVTQPTALLYDTKFRLVALEWVTPVEAVDGVRPVLFEETYHGPVLDPPLFVLHVWAQQCNPDGVFADANPNVTCN